MSNNTNKSTEVHEEFWDLADEWGLSILTISQVTSAPIKVLLSWRDNGTTPKSALNDLNKFLDRAGSYHE
jgi:hypothetical protein